MYGPRRLGLASLAVLPLLAASVAAGEPRIQLKIPDHGNTLFDNFASVDVPAEQRPTLEVWLTDALEEVTVASVRIKLNDTPMTPFVSINALPRGVRAIVKLGATMSPEYTLRADGENVLWFSAHDASRIAYRGQFYLTLKPGLQTPRLAGIRDSPPTMGVVPPEQHAPPALRFGSAWPERTSASWLELIAEVTDERGLRSITIEVNGKDVEHIVLVNNLPVRKKGDLIRKGKMAGEVTGDDRRLVLAIPVKLPKELNVVAVRAESAAGLRARIDRTVLRVKQ